MDFSTLVLTMYLDVKDRPEDDETILNVAIDQSLTAAQLGMNPFYTEHHFRGPWHSSPMQFASYIAPQIPEDCYLGFAVISMPYYHPVRLTEGMNMLDQLTKGHALFGLGSGFPGLEPASMGLTVEHHGTSRASDEALEIMQHLWDFKNGDPVYSFETDLYRGNIVKRTVPAPYRKHHPHVIVTARRTEALERAGTNGWPIFLGTGQGGHDDLLAQQMTSYWNALSAAGHSQDVIDECMRWTCYDVMNVSVADTDEKAEANARLARDDRNAMRDVFTERNSRLADVIPIADELGPREPSRPLATGPGEGGGDNRPRGSGGMLIGNPDTVGRRIQELNDMGVNHLLLRFMGEWAGDTKGIAESSMRLFEKEVAPRFEDTAPLRSPMSLDLGRFAKI